MSQILLKEIFDDAFGAGWDEDTIHGASLNALYDALTGGAIEHGWLGELADDDHAQYHTDARGDARYALLLHAPRHIDGNDDIQDAGAAQKGLLTHQAQTIGGVKTFSSFPVTPSSAPTTDYQVANRKYVDNKEVEALPTSLTAGSVVFSNGSNLAQDNSNLFWDNANNRLGIGTNAPDSILHIKANVPGIVGPTHAAGQLIIQDPDDTVFGNAVITGYESDADGNPDQQLWYLGSSSSSNSNIIFLNRRNSKLQLGTNNASHLTILGDGKIGIGTVTPSAALDVEGGDLVLGDESAAGTTPELKIYGYRSADTLRSLQIGVGVDAADTASFDGLSNYWFDGTIKPVGSILFQTAGTLLDLATNGAYFLPRRLSQDVEPTPAAGELLVWYKPTGGRVRLIYNDADAGVVTVQMY